VHIQALFLILLLRTLKPFAGFSHRGEANTIIPNFVLLVKKILTELQLLVNEEVGACERGVKIARESASRTENSLKN
jgi:hypothetical protein